MKKKTQIQVQTKKVQQPNFIRELLNKKKHEELKTNDIVLAVPTDENLDLKYFDFGVVCHQINNYVYCKWQAYKDGTLQNAFQTTIGTPIKRDLVLKTNLNINEIEGQDFLSLKANIASYQ